MHRPIIEETSVTTLPALNRLFARAVDQHFTYFAQPVRDMVKHNHSLTSLMRAKLDRKRVLLVARSDGQIVGYAIGAAPKSGPAQLFWLYVEPNYRSAGVGRALLSAMIQALGKRGAGTISVATFEHRTFYERQGFNFIRQMPVDGVNMDILTYETKAKTKED